MNGQLAMPFEPFEPVEPLESVEPVTPVEPVEPVEPAGAPVVVPPARVNNDEIVGSECAEEGDFTQPSPLEVRIIRSARRKKSVGAQIKDGVVEVTVPTWMSRAESDKFAEQFRKRFEKTRASTSVDLAARAKSLSRTYGLPKPLSIRWVTNQNSRWGSCTPTDSTIRINNRLAKVPTWVLDYVIVHEICHLRHPNHSSQFWMLVNTYPLTERARGFLLGMGYVDDDVDDDEEDGDAR